MPTWLFLIGIGLGIFLAGLSGGMILGGLRQAPEPPKQPGISSDYPWRTWPPGAIPGCPL